MCLMFLAECSVELASKKVLCIKASCVLGWFEKQE